ncbi:hypothetical protein [Endozoicomonas sp. 8E]|uniref:hypothetical protein n=1 Tax=Endozoicomonas sp. 8E TaxID=3035692 RepID=UPI0029393493|nr:hypothetical protein [Endozoicomonas sp. 8E]WOG26974.1 hypothetical protein P6910_20850 [Endozoicomonas sp. 8E]
MIKHSLFKAMLLTLLLLSFICQADPLTRHFIIELQQDSGFPNQCFSIKPDRRSLPGNPSDIADINGDSGPDSALYYNRQKPISYEVIATLIESVSWQLLYATNLPLAFELILNTRAAPLSPTPYSWLPEEMVFAVGWLLKNYWNHDSLRLNPIEQQEMTSMLTQWDQPFVSTIMLHGNRDDQQQGQLPESSGQQTQQATTQTTSSFTSALYSGFGEGNLDPQQRPHTLGLDCFIHPCHGFCRFRPPFENMANHTDAIHGQNSCTHLANRHCYRCIRHSDPANETSNDPLAILLQCAKTRRSQARDSVKTTAPAGQATCKLIVIEKDGGIRQCEKAFKSTRALSSHKRRIHTGQKTCEVTVVGKDGQQQPCRVVCKNAQSLASHKSKYHCGLKTCDTALVGENGLRRTCGTVCKNAVALSAHKLRQHAGQQTCHVIMVGDYGQQRPCGVICKNAKALSEHKRKSHGVQKACKVIVVEEDGQRRPCGKVCKNALALSNHKRRYHTGQQTCKVTVVGEDGQQRPCGKVCRSVCALSDHKRKGHTGQKTCKVIVVGEDGQRQPCRKVCKNAGALTNHKSRFHTGRQTCDVIVVGEDGQPRPCGKVYKNSYTLSKHKRILHKRKPVDGDQKDGPSPL